MKIGKLALAWAIAGLLSGGTLSAQQLAARPGSDATRPGLSYPGSSTKQVGYEYTKYYAPEAAPASPSDQPAPAAAPAGPATPEAAVAEEEAAPSVIHILGDNKFLKCRGIEIGGWIATSYVWNPQSPADRFNGPVTWTDRANEVNVNEAWTYISKPTDTGGDGYDWGYRADAFWGSSARLDTSSGLENKINANHPFYGVAIPNLYAEGAYNDMKVKAGHFISPVGYMTVGTYNNFFNTIPYTYQYGEPFTHTGVLPTYTATDNLVLGYGVIKGWDNSSNFNKHAGMLGTVTYSNLAKQGDSLAYVQVWSIEPNGKFSSNGAPGDASVALFSPRYFQTLVYSRPLNDKWSYVGQTDFGVQGNVGATTAATGGAFSGGPGGNDPNLAPGQFSGTFTGHNVARWYGLNQYLFYKVNNCWTWGFNYEWFRDESGYRVGGFLPNFGQGATGFNAATGLSTTSQFRGLSSNISGFAGVFNQITLGPRWTPNPNLVIRPNLRFDWYDGPRGAVTGTNPGGALPYDNGSKRQQGILGTDVIVVF
jgi:putative OmpL-like beta-barrel porin-2